MMKAVGYLYNKVDIYRIIFIIFLIFIAPAIFGTSKACKFSFKDTFAKLSPMV